jgi:chemotaxis protein methyltransferase CheR
MSSFDLKQADFNRFKKFVYEHAGIVLNDSKKNLVYNRLAKRLRATGYTTFKSYLDHAESDPTEFNDMMNSITTNLTFFFRENHHFEMLTNDIIPKLMQTHKTSKKIRIWSAGCSTGEEPYSIAMAVRETIPSDWDVKIYATDLDSNVVATGKAGVYKEDKMQGVSDLRKKRFFSRGKNELAGNLIIKDDVKSLIDFSQMNLMKDWHIKERLDIIFCRNVIIYFDIETQKKLFARYADMTKPKGLLFIGHSESLFEVTDKYTLLGQTIYQKD